MRWKTWCDWWIGRLVDLIDERYYLELTSRVVSLIHFILTAWSLHLNEIIAREWFENIKWFMISWYVIHWFVWLIDYMIWSVDRIVCIRPRLERLTGWGAWCQWSEEGNWRHLFDGLFRFDRLTLLLTDWHDAIDRNQEGSYLKPGGWLCLRMMEWIIKSLTDYIIGDRPWNPRNPNSMLRNIASHHAPLVVQSCLFVFLC